MKRMKKAVWFIIAVMFTVLLWAVGYGLPATIAAALLLILFKLTAVPLEGFANELAIRRRLMENDADDIKAGINTIHSLGRVAYELHRITSSSHSFEEVMKIYLTMRQIQRNCIKIISALALIVITIIVFATDAENISFAVFGIVGTMAVCGAIVMGFKQSDKIEEEFINADPDSSDFVIDALPENPLGAEIELDAVYSFEGSTEIIKGITLKIEAGERFGIIGRSNCGKTSLVNLMTKKINPVSGEVYVGGGILRYMTDELIKSVFENKVAVFDNIRPDGDLTGKTVIITSAKTSDIMDCDKIAVMADGMIEAIGTHDTLLMNNALYREIFSAENPETTLPPMKDDFSEILGKIE
jgi:ATP-binding cassette subfamily B protein